MNDDDIWTTSDTEPTATPDDYPTPDAGPDRRGFWTIGRVATAVAVAVVVGTVAYLVASRLGGDGDDKKVATSGDMSAVGEVPASDLWGRTWEVTHIEMGSDVPVSWSKGDTNAALDLDLTVEGELRFSGCNGGFGSATYTGGVLKASDLVGTEMACEGDEGLQLMAYDTTMATFLTDGATVTFDDGTLVLTGPNGTVQLAGPGDVSAPDSSATTVAGDPDASVGSDDLAANLWGSTWELRAITPADSMTPRPLALLPDDTTPMIDTTEVDRLTISGCNGTGGAVHLDGNKLVADGPWAQTKMACYRDLMDQEQLLTEVLDAGPTVSIEADLLTLSGDDWVVLAVRS